jgi:hypothetical protein
LPWLLIGEFVSTSLLVHYTISLKGLVDFGY